MKHVDKEKILTDCQHGVRTRRSCETLLVTLVHDLTFAMDKETQTDMVILDFSKAFDFVPHKRLRRKRHHYGIRGRLHEWITDFLSVRTKSVVIEGVSPESAQVVSGVPKALFWDPCYSSCSPTTFQTTLIPKSDYLLMIVSSAGQSETKKTAWLFNRISTSWLNGKITGMEFHPQKCSVLRVSRARSPVQHPYKLKGHTLEVQESTKYLGVDLQSSMSWKTHIDRIT